MENAAPRAIAFLPPRETKSGVIFDVAALVGKESYCIAGGDSYEEALAWLAFRLGVAPSPDCLQPSRRDDEERGDRE